MGSAKRAWFVLGVSSPSSTGINDSPTMQCADEQLEPYRREHISTKVPFPYAYLVRKMTAEGMKHGYQNADHNHHSE